MLQFERRVVHELMDPALDDATRQAVEQYVDRTLASMPEHLRAGVAGESVAFGAWARVAERRGRHLGALIESWKHSSIDVVRQYVRLLASLVTFAQCELAPEPST